MFGTITHRLTEQIHGQAGSPTPRCRLRALARADRRAARTSRRAALPRRGRGNLARYLARRSASLDRNRGKHPRAQAGRAAACRGPCGWQQGAARVHGGARVCNRRQLGLRAGSPTWPMVRRRADLSHRSAPRPHARDEARMGCGAASPGHRPRGSGLVPRTRHRGIPRWHAATAMAAGISTDPRLGHRSTGAAQGRRVVRCRGARVAARAL